MRFDDDTLQLLSDYVDGALAPDACVTLEERLARSAELREELSAMRLVDQQVGASAKNPPELDWDRFNEEARHRRERLDEQRQLDRLRVFMRPLAAAAAIALLLSGGWWVWNQQSGIRQPATTMTASVSVHDSMRPFAPYAAIVQVSRTAPSGDLSAKMISTPAPRRTLVVTGSTDAAFEDESIPLF